jgi:DNA (cytosine-5)-methyltransferase 1
LRERVFIAGTYVGKERALAETDIAQLSLPEGKDTWNVLDWNLDEHLLIADENIENIENYQISEDEKLWVDTWNNFVVMLRKNDIRIPSFPIWEDSLISPATILDNCPEWKEKIIKKNEKFYQDNKQLVDQWRKDNPQLAKIPQSRRKLEWQAQNTPTLWDAILQFRPSGIRAKKPTYIPALVAINQTTIIGTRKRRLTSQEAAIAQGFPETFTFGSQREGLSYKQMGNAVNVSVVQYVFEELIKRDRKEFPSHLKGIG